MDKHNFQYTKKNIDEVTPIYTIKTPWSVVSYFKAQAFSKLAINLEVPGFRKGKVPKNIAEKHINKDSLINETAQLLAEDAYLYLINTEKIKPISQPQVNFEHTTENEEWKFTITIALQPTIDYVHIQKTFDQIKSEKKIEKIWTPDKGKPEISSQTVKPSPEQQSQKLQKVLELLLKNVNCTISSLLIDQELTRKLTRLIDDIQKSGLTLEMYLASKKTTIEKLKESIKKEIRDAYQIEFILNKISEHEKITVEQKDMEAFMSTITDQKTKESINKNAYYYASFLLRQKTIDYLINL